MKKKVPPRCPNCGRDMKVAGTLRTPGKIRKIFQCMSCPNHHSYLRDGRELGA